MMSLRKKYIWMSSKTLFTDYLRKRSEIPVKELKWIKLLLVLDKTTHQSSDNYSCKTGNQCRTAQKERISQIRILSNQSEVGQLIPVLAIDFLLVLSIENKQCENQRESRKQGKSTQGMHDVFSAETREERQYCPYYGKAFQNDCNNHCDNYDLK